MRAFTLPMYFMYFEVIKINIQELAPSIGS